LVSVPITYFNYLVRTIHRDKKMYYGGGKQPYGMPHDTQTPSPMQA
jgi:hypothetical protein